MAETTAVKEREIIWSPQPRQELALTCPAFELFFGGAAGGGKTDFLLADFLDGIDYGKHHKGILFRKTYPEFEEIIDRSRDLFLPLGASYNESKSKWTFPSGSTLKFRALERDADVHKYQGHQYTWIGFDELPNWATPYCYVYMFSRCRSGEGLPCRIRGTGNPGSPGHVWVKNRFINNSVAEQIYTDPETELTRCFIPSLLDDNQILMLNDPDYEKRLLLLPPHLQRALRYGDWDVFSGQVFEEFNRQKHVIRPIPLDPSWTRFCSMDWGYAKPYSIGWWCVTSDGRLIRYREMYGCVPGELNTGVKRPANEVAKEAWDLSVAEGCNIMVADPACWSKIDDTLSIAEKFSAVGWTMEKANNDRISGLIALHDHMKLKAEDGRPMLLVFEHCHAFIRTIPELIADEKRPEDIDTTGEDHVYDESRYAIMSRQSKQVVRVKNNRPIRKRRELPTRSMGVSVADRFSRIGGRR